MISLLKKKPKLKKTWAIRRNVLESIMEFSKRSYPNEFFAMLVADSSVIDDLYILPATQNFSKSVVFRPDLSPMSLKIIGTVHSHPSGYGVPSGADLSVFRGKQINMIAFPPFDSSSFKVYNKKGEAIFLDVI